MNKIKHAKVLNAMIAAILPNKYQTYSDTPPKKRKPKKVWNPKTKQYNYPGDIKNET